MTRLSGRARGLRAGLAAGILAVLAAVAGFSSLPHPPSLSLPCAFHFLTGLPCLFCGGTRAMRALLHAQGAQALYLNPLAFPALLAALGVVGLLVIEALRGTRICNPEALLTGRLPLFLLALGLAWWLPHIALALKTPKPELVDLTNPIAKQLRDTLMPQAR